MPRSRLPRASTRADKELKRKPVAKFKETNEEQTTDEQPDTGKLVVSAIEQLKKLQGSELLTNHPDGLRYVFF